MWKRTVICIYHFYRFLKPSNALFISFFHHQSISQSCLSIRKSLVSTLFIIPFCFFEVLRNIRSTFIMNTHQELCIPKEEVSTVGLFSCWITYCYSRHFSLNSQRLLLNSAGHLRLGITYEPVDTGPRRWWSRLIRWSVHNHGRLF